MSSEWWTVVIAAASLQIVVLTSAVIIVWRLSRTEMALRTEFSEKQAAISAKIYQVEIWARDEFVRKGSFEIVITRIEAGFRELRSEIGGRLDKVSEKIDAWKQGAN